MNHMFKSLLLILGVLCIVYFVILSSAPQDGSSKYHNFHEAMLPIMPKYDPKLLSKRNDRAWQMFRIWQLRYKRNVSSQIRPFLSDPDRTICQSAVRVLGRLPKGDGEHVLVQTLTKLSNPSKNINLVKCDPFTVRLALGHSRAMKLKGQKRIDAVCRSVDLSWFEVIKMSQKLLSRPSSLNRGTLEDAVLSEVIDNLNEMEQAGEDTTSITSRISLSPMQKVELQASSLPMRQATKMVLNYILTLNAVRREEELGKYLIRRGNGDDDLITSLAYTLNNLNKKRSARGKRGYVVLFRTAALTNDRKLLKILEKLERDSREDKIFFYYAMQARIAMQNHAWYPPLP